MFRILGRRYLFINKSTSSYFNNYSKNINYLYKSNSSFSCFTNSTRSFHSSRLLLCKNKNNINRFSWKEFKGYIRLAYPERYIIGFALLFLGINAGCNLLVPYGMGKSIDSCLDIDYNKNKEEINKQKDESRQKLYVIGGILLGVFVVNAATMFLRVSLLNVGAERIMRSLRKRLYYSLTKQDASFYDKNRTGELINRLTSDTTVISRTLTDSIASGIRRSVEGIGGVSILLYLTPKLTGLMLSIVPPIVIGGIFYGRYIRKLSKDVQDSLSKTTEVAEETISNIRTVKLFANENKEYLRYGVLVDKVYNLGKKSGIFSGSFYGIIGLSVNTALISVMTYGGSMVIDNQLSIGDLTSFLLYSTYVAFALSGIASSYNDICKGIGATERVFELIEREPDIKLSNNPIIPKNICGDIQFKDINFSYPTRSDVQIFNKLSMNIPAGSVIAVVGSSGSGKSTILSLLSRLYDPISGSVLLDGRDIKTLDISWLRKQIGFVNQDPILFSGTIRENIAYGLEELSNLEPNECETKLYSPDIEKLIITAATQANANLFITNFPKGYDTHIGERGITLSGGQKQRIAIARAIVKNPKILVLDEATSALDAESEYAVQKALELVMKNRTTLIVAHRLSTVKKANSIIVLDNGNIVEQGTHNELMNNKSVYSNLVSHQISDDCIDGICIEGNDYTSDHTKGLEHNPGITSPLLSQKEQPGIQLEHLPGKPGPMIAYGPEDAKIRVYWFSDFQCPVCTRAYEPLKWLVRNSEYSNDIRLIFVNYALPSHKHARELAIAGLAAFKQEKFFDLLNIINARVKPQEISTYAARISGFDIEQFEKDRKDISLANQVDYETALSSELGIRGTPGICINGICTSGWSSYFGVFGKVRSQLKLLNSSPIPDNIDEPLSHYLMQHLLGNDAKMFYDLMIRGSTMSINNDFEE